MATLGKIKRSGTITGREDDPGNGNDNGTVQEYLNATVDICPGYGTLISRSEERRVG
mgnify:CR=1 FL=1